MNKNLVAWQYAQCACATEFVLTTPDALQLFDSVQKCTTDIQQLQFNFMTIYLLPLQYIQIHQNLFLTTPDIIKYLFVTNDLVDWQ
jgi:hypothetical protein